MFYLLFLLQIIIGDISSFKGTVCRGSGEVANENPAGKGTINKNLKN